MGDHELTANNLETLCIFESKSLKMVAIKQHYPQVCNSETLCIILSRKGNTHFYFCLIQIVQILNEKYCHDLFTSRSFKISLPELFSKYYVNNLEKHLAQSYHTLYMDIILCKLSHKHIRMFPKTTYLWTNCSSFTSCGRWQDTECLEPAG